VPDPRSTRQDGSLTASITNGEPAVNVTSRDALPTATFELFVTANVKLAAESDSTGFGETLAETPRSARPAAITRSSTFPEDDATASEAVTRTVWVPVAAPIVGTPEIAPL